MLTIANTTIVVWHASDYVFPELPRASAMPTPAIKELLPFFVLVLKQGFRISSLIWVSLKRHPLANGEHPPRQRITTDSANKQIHLFTILHSLLS